MDLELGLFAPDGGNKENNGPLAKVSINGISSQPVDDVEGDRKGAKGMHLLNYTTLQSCYFHFTFSACKIKPLICFASIISDRLTII
jgi:hypothetical protein